MIRNTCNIIACLVVALFLLPTSALAQITTGTITVSFFDGSLPSFTTASSASGGTRRFYGWNLRLSRRRTSISTLSASTVRNWHDCWPSRTPPSGAADGNQLWTANRSNHPNAGSYLTVVIQT